MTTKNSICRGLLVLVAACALVSFASAQDNRNSRDPRGGDRGGDKRGFNPEEFRNRMLNNIREQFEITNDEEWNIIAERLNKVYEVRRSAQGGPSRGGPPMMGAPGGDRTRGGSSGNPEMDGLRSAVQAKATEAELKARLTRLREMRKESEQRLEKVQEELRAVLSVRQEAILVMYGVLP